MKKVLLLGTALCAIFAMSSCKSKKMELDYKKAYDKRAEAAQTNIVTTPTTTPTQTVTVTPVTTPTPATTVTPVAVQDYSNVAVRTEDFSLVNGQPLNAYSVVVGSFKSQENAVNLQNTMKAEGYSPRVIQATVEGATWYRVAATTFSTKNEAAASRASLIGKYPGAWLLYKK